MMAEKPTTPETPKEGWLSGFRNRISSLLGQKEAEPEKRVSSREEYPPSPNLGDKLRSKVEINGVKMDFFWSDMFRHFRLTFPDLSPNTDQGNFIVLSDNAKLALPIFDRAKKLAEEGKNAQEVFDGSGRFMIEHLREKLTPDDGRRPYKDWEGNEIDR